MASDEEEQERVGGDLEASEKRKFGPYLMGSGKTAIKHSLEMFSLQF